MITYEFIKKFFIGLYYISPIIVSLIVIISMLGLLIGRREGWSRINAIYFAFITATTVGYGDFRPNTTVSKLLAILVTFLGILLTGIVVAVGLEAATQAFSLIHPGYQTGATG